MGKLQNKFDPAFGKCDEIKTFLAAYNGGSEELLTSTGGALDVHLASSDISFTANVDLDGVYAAGTNTDPDNVGAIFHQRAATPGDTDQTFRSTGGAGYASILAAALANVHAIDVNAFSYGLDDSGNAQPLSVNSDGELIVNIDGFTATSKGNSLQVVDTNATMTAGSGTATTTAATITALANQSRVWVQNTGSEDILVNGTYPIPCGAHLEFPMCDDITVETASGSATYATLQFAV